MSAFFADTSAVAKRYVYEVGSRWMRSLCRPITEHIIIILGLTTVETVAASARRQRERSLSASNRMLLENHFLHHVEMQYLIVELDDNVLALARALTVKHPLRTLDALELASALRAVSMLGEPLIFLSADPRLLTAATTEGFAVDNPNAHP